MKEKKSAKLYFLLTNSQLTTSSFFLISKLSFLLFYISCYSHFTLNWMEGSYMRVGIYLVPEKWEKQIFFTSRCHNIWKVTRSVFSLFLLLFIFFLLPNNKNNNKMFRASCSTSCWRINETSKTKIMRRLCFSTMFCALLLLL
jgi:hypothetical protein